MKTGELYDKIKIIGDDELLQKFNKDILDKHNVYPWDSPDVEINDDIVNYWKSEINTHND